MECHLKVPNFDDQLHVTTGTLCKSLVNWVLSEEKDKNIEAAIARLMSHSQRTQRLRYYTMEIEDKIKKGVRHLADNRVFMILDAPHEDAPGGSRNKRGRDIPLESKSVFTQSERER